MSPHFGPTQQKELFLINRYLLSTHYKQSIVLGTTDIVVNKIKSLSSWSLVEDTDNKQKYKIPKQSQKANYKLVEIFAIFITYKGKKTL